MIAIPWTDTSVTDNYVLSVCVGHVPGTDLIDRDRGCATKCRLLVCSCMPSRFVALRRRLTLQNVAGRTLVGLRYFNEVDADGNSAWVFESRDVSVLTIEESLLTSAFSTG